MNRYAFFGIGIDAYAYIPNAPSNKTTYEAMDLRDKKFYKGRTDTTKTLATFNFYYFFESFGVYTNFNIGTLSVTFTEANPCSNFLSPSECADNKNNLITTGFVTETKLGPAYRLKLGRGSDTFLPLELWFSAGVFIQSVGLSEAKLEKITGSRVSAQQTVSGYGSIELALFNANLLDLSGSSQKSFAFWASIGIQISHSNTVLPGERNPANGLQFSIPLRFGIAF